MTRPITPCPSFGIDEDSAAAAPLLPVAAAALTPGTLYGPDARLIAAAPDMLAALKVIEVNLSLAGKPSEAELNDLYYAARAAIAKATGS